MEQHEFTAGPDHTVVLYLPPDAGVELDAMGLMAEISADAAARAARGLRILSMTTMPLRHAGTYFGQEGSGFQTKVAIAVVYEHWPGVPGVGDAPAATLSPG
jgi:hypothetical protein